MIPKKMWQALQPLIKDTQDKEINKLKIDEEIITNVEEIPNSLNVFYINSIEEVISKIDTTNCSIDNRDEVKQSVESNVEKSKTEKVNKIEHKLTAAEQKREQELQRKLEKIKENVRIL
ncbi:hypothetical protein NQ314_019833 [Rhamnusium bicolor]|uniref:Uncharacterized protein n=1 Tax=Rhamnusium bicolor TaxID=1586634 RepID=A0AAV8WMF8_9CUCU|nr:hypothetical protein NQ314_019833 [Rhamnusium bicolor]